MTRWHNKDTVFMEVAHTISVLGTCDRKRVGAIIVRDGRCVSWGYNGAPPGLPHCDANNHGYLELYGTLPHEHGCKNATHAEANALAFAARQGISTEGATLYVTVSPCDTCARLCIAAGLKEVRWDEEYRDRSGIELLERAGLVYAREAV
jgi:dCMP deaminase